MMEELFAFLKENHLTIAAMESFTGGLFAAQMTAIPGCSSVFQGSLVTYNDQAKIHLGQIDPQVIKQYGAISKECARDMANQARALYDADIGVSFTGNAGPDGQEGKPAGLIYMAIASKHRVQVFEDQLKLSRNALRQRAVKSCCERILEIFRENGL
ncbi:MAG: CinA family protein [Erysipelotrichaceae bacterium]|jgi:PncC family amidohydrolase|nr:CinA family protein [Erysipelotrichaceae bacterium]